MRPRWLFFWFFIWLVGHGRFTALFFEEHGLSDSQVGILQALPALVGTFTGPALGVYADRSAAEGWEIPLTPLKGREAALSLAVVATTTCFVAYSLDDMGFIPHSSKFTFFVSVQVFYAVSVSAIFGTLDGIALRFLEEAGLPKESYGSERLFGAWGWALGSVILGASADLYSLVPVMLGYIVVTMVLLLGVLSKFSSIQSRHERLGSVTEKKTVPPLEVDQASALSILPVLLGRFLGSPRRFGFVLCAITMAAATSIVEKLLFLFFRDDLQASYVVCGISVVVTVLFEIPIFAYARPLLDRCGSSRLMFIAAFAYCTRVVGYTLVPNQWFLLMLEPLHGVTFSCLKTASVQYVAEVSPKGLEATSQIMWGSITGIFGSVVGSAAGGYVEDSLGAHVLYRGAAAIVSTVFAVYFVILAVDSSAGCSPAMILQKLAPSVPHAAVESEDGDAEQRAGLLLSPLRRKEWEVIRGTM